MTKWRRYEVMMPNQFNDGRPVPHNWIGRAMREIAEVFTGVSFETQIIEGLWRHGQTFYRDNHVRLVVDVPDTPKNRKWMKEFKARWKTRLGQIELWMVSYRIEIE